MAQSVPLKEVSSAGAEGEKTYLLSGERPPSAKRDTDESETIYFKDGERKIDFVLVYKAESKEDEEPKRKIFLDRLTEEGLELEVQDPKYYHGEAYFVKVHCTFDALAKAAEDLLIPMPIREVDLDRKEKPWYRDIWSKCGLGDPFSFFDPKIPEKFKLKNHFCARYNRRNHDKYVGSRDKENFFSSAQRSAIVWYILEKTPYGKEEDEIGVSHLVEDGTFTAAYPLHDGDSQAEDKHDPQNERQLLHHQWSHWTNFYKTQPLDNIRHYFGEKIGLYFAWTGFYTAWLMDAAIIGVIVMLCGLVTLNLNWNPNAREICDKRNEEYFYMCPPCDETCDFWFYSSACLFARISMLFDNFGTLVFAAIMALWAVLFLEFWKRRQFQLQYEWDTLGYEAAEERERPEFVMAIKKKIKNYPPEKKQRYRIFNRVLDRYEYIQPPTILWPKIATGLSILFTLVVSAVGVVFAVIIYRMAVSTLIYRLIKNFPGGPSIADLAVSITGACIQLVAITVMNVVYEYLAVWLTKWELHRTQTEVEDSFTFKMYLFQFINYYASLFYIAFFQGRFTGNPGAYLRIGPFRLEECPTYGCLLELTIQLGIIFGGKQILNDITELGIPYAKTILNKIIRWIKEKRRGPAEEDDVLTRWEKDYEMVPIDAHGMFFEYLELVVQYGFVTLFVAAFPLAPFFAWVNNIIEIRLDAHKFIQVFRRPVAERAQDIGAWFGLLEFVTKLCVLTNAFLIAITSDFINRSVYALVYNNNKTHNELCESGSVTVEDCENTLGLTAWSTSPFELSTLLQPGNSYDSNITLSNFPFYAVQLLHGYNMTTGEKLETLYLPFIDEACIQSRGFANFSLSNLTEDTPGTLHYSDFYNNPNFQKLLLTTAEVEGIDSPDSERITSFIGPCFIRNTTCRFRGQVTPDNEFPLPYWRVLTVKLAFVLLFENIIFIIGILLDWLVPDVPQSVQDEIRREKLLASKIDAEMSLSEPPQPIEP